MEKAEEKTNVVTFPHGYRLSADEVRKLINHYMTKRKENVGIKRNA